MLLLLLLLPLLLLHHRMACPVSTPAGVCLMP
jgi:hypothetical protein